MQHYFASTEPAHVRRGYPHPTTLAFSPDSRALASPTVLARGYTHTEGLRRERGDFDQSIRVWSLPEARVASFSAYAAPTQERDLKWINFDPWLGDGRGLVVAEGPTLRLLTPEGALAASLTLPETYGSAREPLRSVDGAYASFETRGHWVRWRLREPARYDRVRAPSALQPPRGSEYPAPGQFPAEGLHRSSSDRESPGPRDMRQ